MARTTEQKTGNVTVATIGNRAEARRLAELLDAGGVASQFMDERNSPAGLTRARLGGIKVQVARAEAKHAIEILKQRDLGAAPAPPRAWAGHWSQLRWELDGRVTLVLQAAAIVAFAAALAALVFF